MNAVDNSQTLSLIAQDGWSLGRYLEIALIFLVFFVAGGAPVPHVNETHYLAKAKHYWQPEWLAGDLFLESGKAHLTFYWTVGVLTKWFELPTVAWIGRVAAWLALAVSWHRLSRAVSGLRLKNLSMGGAISALLFVTLIDWTNFAGEWVVGGVEGKCFAYAFVFWGLAALAEQRWRWVWPCLGAASAFHVLVGGWSVIAASMVWLSLPRERRPILPSMLPALLLGGVLALPGILPALQLTQASAPGAVVQANQIYVFDRLPHHLAPLTMNPTELGNKTLRFGLLLLGFAWLRFFCTQQSGHAGGASKSFQRVDLLMRFALGALLISVAGLAWELSTWNHPGLSARLLKFYVFRLADIAVPLATSVGVVWLIQKLLQRQSKWGASLLFLAITLPLWHLLGLSWQRYQHPIPPAVKMRHPAAWLETCDWVRENTPEQARFLVPRRAQSFKWYAHRSDLVTWKDVPQSADALLEWRDRYHSVHRYTDQEGNPSLHHSLAVLGKQRIRELAEEYQIDYLLTVDYPPLDLPIAFAKRPYVVYRIQPSMRIDQQ